MAQLGLRDSPSFHPSKVFVKRRSWSGRYNQWEERVVSARVLCPSSDVSKGFIVKSDEGSYMTTMVAVEHVEEVSGAFEVPEPHAGPEGLIPERRL